MFIGEIDDNEEHRHHAIQLTIGLNDDFHLYFNTDKQCFGSVLIDSDYPHKLIRKSGKQILILIDTELSIGRKLKNTYLQNKKVKCVDEKFEARFISELHTIKDVSLQCDRAQEVFDKIIRQLVVIDNPVNDIEVRIHKAIDFMKELEFKQISVKSIAKEIGLSESRLVHLFKDVIGIPIRRYLLWLRLNEAVKYTLEFKSLTDGAHHAGFADSAHFSRTFRQMFGLTPSDILKNDPFIQVISCYD